MHNKLLERIRKKDAAVIKWNFHKYMPGLVGKHCIPVDPYYLVYKFRGAKLKNIWITDIDGRSWRVYGEKE